MRTEYERVEHQYRPHLAATDGQARAAPRVPVETLAHRYRRSLPAGAPVGRLRIPRLGLDAIVVNGTDASMLRRGPGRDPRTAMPGEHRLVYVAGHRTTYGAPFAHIDRLRAGDRLTLTTPYAVFTYAVHGYRIVPADDLSVLRSRGREELLLQACHPRFFATHRYIVDARPVAIAARGVPTGRSVTLGATRVS